MHRSDYQMADAIIGIEGEQSPKQPIFKELYNV